MSSENCLPATGLPIEDDVRRATKLLETVMQASGLTRKELDLMLSAGPGYVSQVLTGRMELKMRHVLAILRALHVEPSLYFQTLYPETRPSTDQTVMEEFLKRFQHLGFGTGASSPQVANTALDGMELERLIRSAVHTALADRLPMGSPWHASDSVGPGGSSASSGSVPASIRRRAAETAA